MHRHITLGQLEPILWLPVLLGIFPSASTFNPVIHPSLSDITAHTPDSLIYQPVWRVISHLNFAPQLIPQSLWATFGIHSFQICQTLISSRTTLSCRKWENGHKTLSKYSQHLRQLRTTPSISSGLEQPRQPPAWDDQSPRSSEAYRSYIRNNLNDLCQAQAHISSFKPLGVFT